MNELFRVSDTFTSLSIKDLLEARELFHYQLMSKRNVVATAIGLYRVRHGDPWPSKDHPKASRPRHRKAKRRTLFNSEVRPYSWPCVYVFVSVWDTVDNLANDNPSDVVPRTLFLPDGRAVPVCVIEARRDHYSPDLEVDPALLSPRTPLTPGAAILNRDGQGGRRVATAGCLVTDGQAYYLLTSRHALGAAGTTIEAFRRNGPITIGETAPLGETRVPFKDVYPHFQSDYQYLLMDTGLVTLDDIRQWSAAFRDLPPVEDVLDLYDYNLTLQLIGQKVVGRSAVTGAIRGEIHGLFYRYKALGGYEYLTDFLIGPSTDKAARARVTEPSHANVALSVHHGDSGTVLFLEEAPGQDDQADERPRFHPFALLWGRHEFLDDGTRTSQPFALATSLSTALQRLNMDFVRDLNVDNDLVWGWVGHYVIGGLLPSAIGLLKSPKLRQFTEKNLALLTVSPNAALTNDPRVITKTTSGAYDLQHPQFVALADVPDNVWKSNVNVYITTEGTTKKHHAGPGARGQFDNPNHFADMDLPYGGFKTFLAFNLDDPQHRLRPDVWLEYYKSVKPLYDKWAKALDKKEQEDKHWGALPFRVWQLYDTMVAAAAKGDQDLFLVAGGALIHYVGDACQPLHTSYLSAGDPDRTVPRPKAAGNKLEADGVHSGYEDDMIAYGYQEKHLEDLIRTEIKKQQAKAKEAIDPIGSGFEAASALLNLIAATHDAIAPQDIVKKWVQVKGQKPADRAEAMWNTFGTDTAACMARGCRYLAAIWQGAWKTGTGDATIAAGSARSKTAVAKLYNNPKIVPSVRLDVYPTILKGIPKP